MNDPIDREIFPSPVPQLPGFAPLTPAGTDRYGTLFLSRHLLTGVDAAVRTVDLRARRAEVEQLMPSARRLTALNHPALVPLLDVGSVDGILFVASELMTEDPLAKTLQEGAPMPEDRLRAVARTLLDGLMKLKDEGFCHGGISPETMIVKVGSARMILPGLVYLVHSAAPALVKEFGFSPYIAPEQHEGKIATPASDVYSLGLVLYECAARRPAFTAPNPADLARAKQDAEFVPLHEAAPQVSEGLSFFISALLLPDPTMRPQTREEFARGLKVAFEMPSPQSYEPKPPTIRAAKSTADSKPTAGPQSAQTVAPKRNRRLILLGGGVGLGLLASFILALQGLKFQPQPAERPPQAPPLLPRQSAVQEAEELFAKIRSRVIDDPMAEGNFSDALGALASFEDRHAEFKPRAASIREEILNAAKRDLEAVKRKIVALGAAGRYLEAQETASDALFRYKGIEGYERQVSLALESSIRRTDLPETPSQPATKASVPSEAPAGAISRILAGADAALEEARKEYEEGRTRESAPLLDDAILKADKARTAYSAVQEVLMGKEKDHAVAQLNLTIQLLRLINDARKAVAGGGPPLPAPVSPPPAQAPQLDPAVVDTSKALLTRFAPSSAGRAVILKTESGALRGQLLEGSADTYRLKTAHGMVSVFARELEPYSLWRIRSFLAGSDAAKRLALGEYCRGQGLLREARWEFAAAQALDAKVEVPDLEKLNLEAMERFLQGASQLNPDALRKRLAAAEAEHRKSQELERKKAAEELRVMEKIAEVRTLVDRGPVSKRIDVVLISEGFAGAEQTKFNELCDQIVKGILTIEPFSNYPSYVNFHRINVVEPQSGLSGNTACGCDIVNGALRCNIVKTRRVARHAPDADLVIVIANVREGRASAQFTRTGLRVSEPSGYLTLNVSGHMDKSVLHELGHAFGNLDDEYVNEIDIPGHPDIPHEREWEFINVTRESDPKRVKWHYWMTPPPPKGIEVGCYEGAYYRPRGYYRPQMDCRMNASVVGAKQDYCVVCFEQMEKSFYRLVCPIDDSSPLESNLTVFTDDDIKLTAQAVIAEGRAADLGRLVAKWFVDGVPTTKFTAKERTTVLPLRPLSLSGGRHEVALRIEFQNKRIRRDNGVLSGHRVWQVDVIPMARPKPVWSGDLAAGRLSWAFGDESKLRHLGLRPVILEYPPGAAVDSRAMTAEWKRNPAISGAFGMRVGLVSASGDMVGVEEKVQYFKGGKANTRPYLRLPEEIKAEEAKPLYWKVEALDLEGDGLTYSAENLPEGAMLDRMSGELFWEPAYGQSGAYENIKITVKDGASAASAVTRIVVGGTAPPKEFADLKESELVRFVRSDRVEVVLAAMELLDRMPVSFQTLESERLLRHARAEIAKKALERLKALLEIESRLAGPIFLYTVEGHVWELSDFPEAMDLIERTAIDAHKNMRLPNALRAQADKVAKLLAEVRAYNKYRGL